MAKSKRREKKRRRKSNIGLKKWRQAVPTTIQKSATSSAKRGRNSASIRRRPQRSSDWKSTIESLTRGKLRELLISSVVASGQ
jgi:hypothetical protein